MNVEHLLKTQSYIDGQWVSSQSGDVFEVHNPFDDSLIAKVASLGVDETRMAIEAAHKAFSLWRCKTAGERAELLRKWYELQIQHTDELAYILTLEQGKPLAEAKAEIKYGASYVEWFSEESKRVYGDTIPSHTKDTRIITLRQPVGVVAAITPWNFPNAMITRKVAPALAVGCTIVLKPSEDTPLSALALAFLAEKAGIPKGVFNVVTTDKYVAVGKELTTHKLVRKISFTGSTEVGKILMRQSVDTVKKVSMELGGNAPFIIFEDADLDKAVTGLIASKFRNAGQTCVCANRIFVHEAVYEAFAEKLTNKVKALKMGNGLEDGIDLGPLINAPALENTDKLVKEAVASGAKIWTGGEPSKSMKLGYLPTVLTNVNSQMLVCKQEIFGPVAPLVSFKTDEEVIAAANNVSAGLASYFYGNDISRVWKIAEALEYGMVGINTGMISTPVAPFGGIKESGMGREGSMYGIDDYTELKYLCIGNIN